MPAPRERPPHGEALFPFQGQRPARLDDRQRPERAEPTPTGRTRSDATPVACRPEPTLSDYRDACAELGDVIQRLAPRITGREDGLVGEWTVLIGVLGAEDGDSTLQIVPNPAQLRSHTLGQLRFAQISLEHAITHDDRD